MFFVLQCAESLARIQAGLTSTANKRERVKILHKKSESHAMLHRSLQPGVIHYSVLCTIFIKNIDFSSDFDIISFLFQHEMKKKKICKAGSCIVDVAVERSVPRQLDDQGPKKVNT